MSTMLKIAAQNEKSILQTVPNNRGEGNSYAAISGLSAELILKIFSYLKPFEAAANSSVCREWNILLKDNSLWNHFLRSRLGFIRNVENPKAVFQSLVSNLANGIYSLRVFPTSSASNFRCLAVSNDGKLISSNIGRFLMVQNLKTGEYENIISFPSLIGSESCISTLLPTKSGELVSGHQDGSIAFWNLQENHPPKKCKEHKANVCCLILSEHDRVISGSIDGMIKIWDPETGLCEKTLKDTDTWGISSLALSKNGKLISGSLQEKMLRIWNLETGLCERTLQVPGGISVRSLLVAQTGEVIAGDADGNIHLWNFETGAFIKTLGAYTRRYENCIKFLAIARNGQLIAAFENGTIKAWDIEKGICKNTFVNSKSNIGSSFVFTKDSQLIFSSQIRIEIWDFAVSLFELAGFFEGDEEERTIAMDRFNSLPKKVKDEIYGELYILLQPFPDDNPRCGENAFYSRNERNSTPCQRAQAIRNYLNCKSKRQLDLAKEPSQ